MLRKLARLSHRERVLLALALWWVLIARAALALRVGSLVAKQSALSAMSDRLPRLGSTTADQAVWAVTAAARRVPGTRCLAWALALRGLLGQAGVASDLCIGVAIERVGVLKAHAWVQCSRRSFSWGDDVHGYTVLRPSGTVS